MVNIILLIATIAAAPIKFDLQKTRPNYEPIGEEILAETKLEQIHKHMQGLMDKDKKHISDKYSEITEQLLAKEDGINGGHRVDMTNILNS
jgi:hypothetical protein